MSFLVTCVGIGVHGSVVFERRMAVVSVRDSW